MTFRKGYMVLLVAVFSAGSAGCGKDKKGDEELLLGVAAYAGILGKEKEAALAAGRTASGLSAAVQAVGASNWAFMPSLSKKHALASLQKALKLAARQMTPHAIPTFFTCHDGTCNVDQDEVMSGTSSCNSGTVTANAVALRISPPSAGSVSITQNGSFSFDQCRVIGFDYGQLPQVRYAFSTLSGDVHVNGRLAFSSTASAAGLGGSFVSTLSFESQYEATDLLIEGQATSLNLKDATTMSFSGKHLGNGVVEGIFQGTVALDGIVNGTKIALSVPVNSKARCTYSSADIVCE